VIEAFQKVGREIPINIKFCFEGMEESGSVGLEKVVQDECKPGKFFSDVDYFCISDNYWLGSRKPCVTYGLRGMAYFFLEIEGPGQDLHSGLFGGVVHEPMVDLVHLFSKLVDSDGKILVPNIHDSVRPVTPEEMKTYESIDFDPEEFRKVVGSQKLSKTGKTEILQHRWRFPSLSIHGVEGAFSGSGSKTVIPKKVVGKFSFRLVPDQDPKDIEKHVQDYLKKEFAKLKSPNKMNVQLFHGARAWLSPTDHPNYEAARKAIKEVFGVEPDLTREGGSIPIVLTFQEASGKNVLLLPVGCADDGAHSQNEKFNRVNYINGCKLLAHYFEEIAKAGKTSTAQKRALETKDSSESPKKRKQ
jgi:nonspecific dipeptidase